MSVFELDESLENFNYGIEATYIVMSPSKASPAPLPVGSDGLSTPLFIPPTNNFWDSEDIHVDYTGLVQGRPYASPVPIPPGTSSLLIGFFVIPEVAEVFNFDLNILTTDGSSVEFTDKTLSNDIRSDIVYLA